MAIVEKKTPYELLVRFSDAGEVAGASVRYMKTTSFDGTVIQRVETPHEPFSLEGEFPLDALISASQSTHLGSSATLRQENESLTEALAAIEKKCGLMLEDKSNLEAHNTLLKAQVSEAQESQQNLRKHNAELQTLIDEMKKGSEGQ